MTRTSLTITLRIPMTKKLPLWLTVCLVIGSTIDLVAQATYQTKENIQYRTGAYLTDYMESQCRLDLYYPTDSTGFATVVWFHGGGLTGGERYIPKELSAQGIAVVPVSYRLAPRVSNPAYLEDAAASVAWVFEHIEEYGGDPARIFVAGHSAGGYLASMVGLDKRWLAKWDIDADEIAGLIPYSGHAITHFQVRKEQGIAGTQPIVDEYAPLYHVRADAPPYVIVTRRPRTGNARPLRRKRVYDADDACGRPSPHLPLRTRRL